MVRQEHALQQGDATIDEFYTQSAAIWRQLDSLRTAVCGTCPCCLTVRADLEFQRVYEFLSRLRKEFEPRRAQLLARGRVPLSEVLAELRAEETRLRGAGLLEVPSVLAARGPSVPSARGPPVPSARGPPAQGLLSLGYRFQGKGIFSFNYFCHILLFYRNNVCGYSQFANYNLPIWAIAVTYLSLLVCLEHGVLLVCLSSKATCFSFILCCCI